MNIDLNKIKLLPLWDQLDFTEKGLLMNIILNVINNPIIGYIESEDHILNILKIKKSELTYDLKIEPNIELKKFLSFDFSGMMLDAIKSIYETNLNEQNLIHAKLSYDDFMYYLWKNKWKKNIFLFFEPINKDLQKEFPFLKSKKGFFSKFLYLNINNQNNSIVKQVIPVKKKRTKKIIIELDQEIYDFYNTDLINNSICLLNNKISFLTQTKVFNILNIESAKKNEQDNYNIWTLGVNMLSSNLYDKKDSNKKLAYLIKKYGKENLSKVIAEVSLYPNKPLDVYPVFINKLKMLSKGIISKEEKVENKAKSIGNGIVL